MNGSRFTITHLPLTCLVACLASCASAPRQTVDKPVRFTDVTALAGIRFQHNSGGEGKKWLPETLGPGCAVFDADGDGWLDLLIVNGKDWSDRGRRTTAVLYRNRRDGAFEDITKGSGLDFEAYSLGRGHRRLRQRWPGRRLYHGARRRPAVSQ